MHPNDYAELATFVAIAETGSFRRAAARLDRKPSTISHAMHALEERLGVRLLHRTTRSVALTEAGQALFAQVAPALGALSDALDSVNAHRAQPAGSIRLSVPRCAATAILLPRLHDFCARYPDIRLDITADNRAIDIVREGYDAGIRLGENLANDMIAVPLTGPLHSVIVAAPAYLARHGLPQTPAALARHRCLGFRQPGSRELYRWEIEDGDRAQSLTLTHPLIFDDPELLAEATVAGLGISYGLDLVCAPHLRTGRLTALLTAHCPCFPGFYLYYPDRRISPALRALIDSLRPAAEPLPGRIPADT
mgnify:FL=1